MGGQSRARSGFTCSGGRPAPVALRTKARSRGATRDEDAAADRSSGWHLRPCSGGRPAPQTPLGGSGSNRCYFLSVDVLEEVLVVGVEELLLEESFDSLARARSPPWRLAPLLGGLGGLAATRLAGVVGDVPAGALELDGRGREQLLDGAAAGGAGRERRVGELLDLLERPVLRALVLVERQGQNTSRLPF